MSGVLGEPAHMIYDTCAHTFNISNDIPTDCWIMGDDSVAQSIDALVKLSGKQLPKDPSQAYRTMFDALGAKDVAWRHALPGATHSSFIRTLLATADDAIATGPIDYCRTTFMKGSRLLSSLQPACIDAALVQKLCRHEKNASNRSTLASFTPSASGIAESVVYDRFATLTGRLTVKSGPRILTLPKRFKHIIRSRFEGGSIVSIDYSSLEPRIALAAVDRDAPDDVYAYVLEGVNDRSIDRQQAKIMTIAMLYGASSQTIAQVTGLDERIVKTTMRTMHELFDIERLDEMLFERMCEKRLTNAFGRPLQQCDRRKLINHYVQSTAVDCALVGFDAAVQTCVAGIIPLYVIHDALLVDVHPGAKLYIEGLTNACETIDGFACRFPVTMKELKDDNVE